VNRLRLGLAALVVVVTAGCQGNPSSDPPVHLVPDMDWQPKFQAMEESSFFGDDRAMRPLVEGTVAQGHLDEDDAIYRGKNGEAWVDRIPLTVDAKLLARGQDRFNIYCAPCHDMAGTGQGLVIKHGYRPGPMPYGDRAPAMKDGEIFDVISNGVRNMPAYRAQIPVMDRWAIVSWVRVLAKSQHATLDDVPTEMKGKLEPEGSK
jgi:mono/diheme cytochrome c family protein